MLNLRIPLSLLLVAGLWLVALCSLPARGQCAFSEQALTDGEEISYEISYNWGPFWVHAGIVTFKTRLERKQDTPAWYLVSTGRTYRSYDFLFKVRDTYETWIDATTFQTLEFRRYIFEGGYQLQNRSWFDYPRRIIFSNTKINDEPLVIDTLRMIDCTRDMLSAVYYTRALNLNSFTVREPIPVFVAIDDSVYRINIRFLGKEIVEHPGGSYYPCNKFSATMVEGTIFTKDQEAFVWVSDDLNKVPIYIEAKILVGSVKAYIKEAKGLKQPLLTVHPQK
ncbi:MAG: DUF3108 domain-containing protein [Bacteroidales bacterium]|nr:DUF3108 domain-containing protein [Bacteroidales bacterium]